jgi:hypothetical protein
VEAQAFQACEKALATLAALAAGFFRRAFGAERISALPLKNISAQAAAKRAASSGGRSFSSDIRTQKDRASAPEETLRFVVRKRQDTKLRVARRVE